MSRKDTIENMHSIAKKRGGRCLSAEYADQRTPLRWQCAKGHTWDATQSMVKGSRNKPGTWCRICGVRAAAKKRMYTLEDMQHLAKEHEGGFASKEYMGSQVKHRWRCNQYPSHPEFEMIPNAVQQGQWCPKCSGNTKPTLTEINELARNRHPLARCMSTDYKNSSTPLEWQCGVEGHPPFVRPYRSVRYDGGWCKLCRQEKPRPKKYDREMLIRFASGVGGALVSEEPYRSTKQGLRWRCADGHEFSRSVDSILSYRSFCPECTKRAGLREQYIRELFSHMFAVPFERRRDLPWLINNRGNAMELDGYNSDLLLAFEHNGQQHYELDGYFMTHPDQLKSRLADDADKVRLCRENAVSLIVIPFYVPLKEIQSYISRELANVTIAPPNTTNFEPGLLSTSELERLGQHAARLGGRLLSNRYKGSAEKLRWQCKNPEHPPFETTPSAVINNGHWCRRCACEKSSESYRVPAEQVQEWALACNGELVLGAPGSPTEEKGFSLADKAEFRCLSCNRRQSRTVRQVKEGRLCLCHTKKTRIDRVAVEEKLSARSLCLVESVPILRGRTHIMIQCKKCGTHWAAKVSNVVNSGVGCPKCRRNAAITIEKARELGERIGFLLRSVEVSGGMDVLHWECKTCGKSLDKSYREIRSLRRCPACVRIESVYRLKIS